MLIRVWDRQGEIAPSDESGRAGLSPNRVDFAEKGLSDSHHGVGSKPTICNINRNSHTQVPSSQHDVFVLLGASFGSSVLQLGVLRRCEAALQNLDDPQRCSRDCDDEGDFPHERRRENEGEIWRKATAD